MAYTKLTANRAALVTPSDTDLIPNVSNPDGVNNGCALYIGTPGNVKVQTAGGDILKNSVNIGFGNPWHG